MPGCIKQLHKLSAFQIAVNYDLKISGLGEYGQFSDFRPD